MTTETTEHRVSRLEGAYDQIDKRLTEQRQNTESQFGELGEETRGIRTEIHGLRTEVREDIQELRGEIHDLRTEVREGNQGLRGEIHGLRIEMREDNHSLRTEFNTRLDRVANIMIGGIIAVVGAVTASIVVNLINS